MRLRAQIHLICQLIYIAFVTSLDVLVSLLLIIVDDDDDDDDDEDDGDDGDGDDYQL